MTTYTTAQIEAGMSKALAAGNMEAVVGLLHLLATQEPEHARLILNAIELGGATK